MIYNLYNECLTDKSVKEIFTCEAVKLKFQWERVEKFFDKCCNTLHFLNRFRAFKFTKKIKTIMNEKKMYLYLLLEIQ